MKARLPKGVGGGAQNMQTMMKQAQAMQEDMERKQQELEAQSFSAVAGGGMVEVTINGAKQVTDLSIKPEVVDPEDVEMLQDLIISAINECLRTIEDVTNTEMEKITGGLQLPGM